MLAFYIRLPVLRTITGVYRSVVVNILFVRLELGIRKKLINFTQFKKTHKLCKSTYY